MFTLFCNLSNQLNYKGQIIMTCINTYSHFSLVIDSPDRSIILCITIAGDYSTALYLFCTMFEVASGYSSRHTHLERKYKE